MPTLMCTASRQCQVHYDTPASSQQVPAAGLADDRGGGSTSKENYEPDVKSEVDLRVKECGFEGSCIPAEQILDFVVIGNGPSGICLSYMLSGNWPYYTWNSEDEMLHARLMEEPEASLVEQDLEFLSDGLEGRSNNPVSILLDTLQRPKADLGLDLPPDLTWKLNADKAQKHVVLGQGQPGGVWQTLDGNLKTVSLGAWMQLPNLSMPEWEQHSTDLINNVNQEPNDSTLIRRTRVSSVAEYYTDYVKIKGLDKNFRNHTVVTKVRKLKSSELCKLTIKTCDKNINDDKLISKKDNMIPTNKEECDIKNNELRINKDDYDKDASEVTEADINNEDLVNRSDSSSAMSIESTNLSTIMERSSDMSESSTDSKTFDIEESENPRELENLEQEDLIGDDHRTVICCLCTGCTSLEPGCCPIDNTCDPEELFTMEDDDLSSVCSSLTTQHSFSPVRETREPSYSGCLRSASCTNSACMSLDTFSSADLNYQQPSSYASMNIPIPMSNEMICPSWDPIINPYLFSFPSDSPTASSSTFARSINQRRSSLQPGSCYLPRTSCQGSYRQRSSYQPKSCLPDFIRCEKVEPLPTLFEVSGYEMSTCDDKNKTTPFKYLTQNVVLATGLNKPNKLEVVGEDLNFVFHQLSDLDAMVASGGITSNSDPIMIIGAGLTSADAIISAQAYNIPVVHVFRRSVKDPNMILNKLPMNLYPEYENVRNMMAGGSVPATKHVKGGEHLELEHPKYKAFAETSVEHISKDREVTLIGPNTDEKLKVSCVLVLIGASLKLDFLEPESQGLGRVPEEPVNKSNPVDIDVFTHQAVNVPGVFALGPLVGDNFVRFLQGGALAITSFAHKQKEANKKK